MHDVIVIGGGASGMFAAGRAAEKGRKVLLIERNERLGKKLSITGKGRCNITNSGGINDFIENYGSNGKFLYRAFSVFFNQDLIDFFHRYGVETKEERGGRVFPVSDRSGNIVVALENYLKDNNVDIKYGERVKNLAVEDIFNRNIKIKGVLLQRGEIIEAEKVIIATGGLSYPLTGSTGDGYTMAKNVGHTIVALRPSLVPLEIKEKFVKDLQGLTLKNVEATVFSDDKIIASEFGDMLFTHFGVSGPIILSLSKSVVLKLEKKENVTVSINLKPALDKEKLGKRLIREFENGGLKSYKNVMKNLLPNKLVSVFVGLSGIPAEKKCNQIRVVEREKVIKLLTDFRITITKARPIDKAIVTSGGVALNEINPHTMESKKVKGLYFCGEVIDIDGTTGGYNLQSAFSTAYLAANSL